MATKVILTVSSCSHDFNRQNLYNLNIGKVFQVCRVGVLSIIKCVYMCTVVFGLI